MHWNERPTDSLIAKLHVDEATLTITESSDPKYTMLDKIITNLHKLPGNLKVVFKEYILNVDTWFEDWHNIEPMPLGNSLRLFQSLLSTMRQSPNVLQRSNANANVSTMVQQPDNVHTFWERYAKDWRKYYVDADQSIKILTTEGSAPLVLTIQSTEIHPSAGPIRGGGRKVQYLKTNTRHTCKDGVERVVYKLEKSNYVKRQNRDGKYRFVKIAG